MMLDEYLDYLGKTAREEGLLETPYLMLDESLNLPNYRIVCVIEQIKEESDGDNLNSGI